MPIYEYSCNQCGAETEVIQKFSDPPLDTCACGGALSKLLSQTSFQLKGTGWYSSDYKRPAASKKDESAAPVQKDVQAPKEAPSS